MGIDFEKCQNVILRKYYYLGVPDEVCYIFGHLFYSFSFFFRRGVVGGDSNDESVRLLLALNVKAVIGKKIIAWLLRND